MRFFILFEVYLAFIVVGLYAHGFELPTNELLQKAVNKAAQEFKDRVNQKTETTNVHSDDRSANKGSAPKGNSDLGVAKAGDETQWKSVLQKHPDFKLVEKTNSASLESSKVFNINIQQGAYYAFRARLTPGSSWNTNPTLFIPLLPEPGREPMNTSIGPKAWGPSEAIFILGPVRQSAKIEVSLEYNMGRGNYNLEVYKRPGSDAERNKDNADLAKYRKEDAELRSRLRNQTCDLCASELTSREMKICLERRGVTMSDCGW